MKYKIIISLFIIMLMAINLVSAATFDNQKSALIKGEGISKYGKIEITNWFGLGSTLATLELKKNTDTCSSSCSAETEITLYNDGALIDDIKFMELQTDGKYIEKPIKSYQFYLKIPKDNNFTYEKYNLGDSVKAGTYTIQLEGEKELKQTIDWQIISNGVLINDWILWSATFETGCDKADSDYEPSGFFAQTFTAPTTGNITTIGFYWREYVNLHTCELYINSTSGTNPAGSLYHGSIDPNNIQADTGNNCNNMIWENFTISPAVDVIAGTKYFVSVRCYQADGGVGGILFWGYNSGGGWANAERETSTDYSSWNVQTNDFLMGVWGGGLPDTTAPLIQIFIPIGIINYGSSSENLSWNVTDLYLQSIWYNYNGTNRTLYGAVNSTIFNLSNSPYNLTLYANDSFGNTNSSYVSWSYKIFENSQTYNPTITEFATETFYINLTYDTTYIPSASLIYNNTEYVGSSYGSSGNNIGFSRTITIPANSGGSFPFYWKVGLTNSTATYYFNSTNYTQSVNLITLGMCNATYTDIVLNFTFYEEGTFSLMNSSIDINLNYWLFGSSGSDYKTFTFQNLSQNLSNYQVCFSPVSATFTIDGVVSFAKTGYDRREYFFTNALLNNITQNIPLYLALITGTDFVTYTLLDEGNTPIQDAIIRVERWDIGTGNFYMIGMITTDVNGQGGINLFTTTAGAGVGWYRESVIVNGVTYLTTTPSKITGTTKSLRVFLTQPSPYQYFNNINYLFTYNNATSTFSLIYNDLAGLVATGCLRVSQLQANKTTQIYYSCSYTPSGVIPYTLTQNGTFIGSAEFRLNNAYANVYKSVKTIIVNKGKAVKFIIMGKAGYVASFLLVGTMGLVGVASGSIFLGAVLIIASTVFCTFIGWLDIPTSSIFSLIGVVVLILISLKRRYG